MLTYALKELQSVRWYQGALSNPWQYCETRFWCSFTFLQRSRVGSNQCNLQPSMSWGRMRSGPLRQNKHRRHKLDALWEGPYEIKEVQLPNLVIQQVGKRKKRTIHVNLVKPFCSQEGQDENNSSVDCRN